LWGKNAAWNTPSKDSKAEFVELLRKQVEALELDAYIGLDGRRVERKYDKRQEAHPQSWRPKWVILSDPAALAWAGSIRSLPLPPKYLGFRK